ncbi:MAG: hypothetical protein LAO18_22235 [Acidobacteriia bacterium]|nr:hypothetical protein [Terriglobia bacterium]
MKIIDTSTMIEDDFDKFTLHQIYNGLDACVTYEVLDALLPQLDNYTAGTYEFSRALQGPALEMRLRGVRIDNRRRQEVIEEYYESLSALEAQLEYIVSEGCGLWNFNWRSNSDLKELFYVRLGIPPIRKQGRITVDRSALEKMEAYTVAKPIVRHLEAMRDIGKKIQVLKTAIDSDCRIRTSYNIGGTSTGRFSSSFSEFGTGTNLQNIEESLRSVFISDPGMKMAYLDAQQGESRVVGAIEWNLFRDGRYLDACEGGDLHTAVAKLCWPELDWPGDLAGDREVAERIYYRHYDRRFMCKKIGHGSNYGGKPRTLAAQAKVDIDVISDFQPKYFLAFPAHLRWHADVQQRLNRTGHLVSLTGRKRWFLGRRSDDSTLREAIAYDPQGSLADILNGGMLNVWRSTVGCQLLMQIHDAILIQYPEEQEDKIIPKVLKQLEQPLALKHDRELVIPYDAKVGWNWGKYDSSENVDGLKTWKGGDTRQRTKEMHLLDRPVRRAYRRG